ncbi:MULTISPECIES: ABC transporter substrate-binding protein [unclassified Microbacterium]|uniref:ABC transporter substrate-binding protein n=1 Tax=unclassified Microbacterium TaxID=2609290 RepID=UPI001E5CD6E9|nr:extracellular solute-binding protein [Microbacterium sp. Au-Mic1]MCE4026415.1 extracellular solute-binding protein [Microbacterium sp. Au-Mic1]
MIKGRLIPVTGIAAIAAVALAGCSGAAAPASSDASGTEKVTLHVLVNVTPNLTEEYWNSLVKPFEKKNPNIDVVIQNPGAEGVAAAVPRLLASGDAPDVVQSLAPTAELAPELVDLSKYAWAKKGPLADQYSIDGKNYMAGIGFQLQSLVFYNKKAFSDAGITTPPKTVDQLTDDLGKIKAAGWDVPVQTGGDWMTSHTLQVLGLPTIVSKDPKFYQDISTGKTTFTKAYGPAVETYADWVSKGYIPKDALGIKYPDAEQAFLSGKSAIYTMGSWFVGTQAKATDSADIGVFRAPAEKSSETPAMGANIASPYSILNSSKNQDAAAKLIEYLTTDKTAVTSQLKVDGNFRDGYEYEMTPLGEELQKIVSDTKAASYTPTGGGYGERTMPAGYSGEINTQTQALLGGTSAADVLKSMDDWFAANAN